MRELIKQFEKQGMVIDEKQSQMDDAMDSAMSSFDDEGAEKDLLEQVLGEIGLNVNLPGVPAASAALQKEEEDDLFNRINNLKNFN